MAQIHELRRKKALLMRQAAFQEAAIAIFEDYDLRNTMRRVEDTDDVRYTRRSLSF